MNNRLQKSRNIRETESGGLSQGLLLKTHDVNDATEATSFFLETSEMFVTHAQQPSLALCELSGTF